MGELAAAWRGGRWRGGPRRWAWLAAAVVVVALAGYGVVHALTAGASAKPAPPARAVADRGAVTTEVATTGTVQPAQTRSLSFAVAGTVASVAVRPGTTVTPGQVLAQVDESEAAAAVDSAQQALDDAEDALTTAEAGAASATTTGSCTGADVPAGYPSSSPPASPTPTAAPSPTVTHTVAPTRTPAPARTGGPARSTAPAGGAPGACPTAGGAQGGNQGGAQGGGGDPVYSAEQRVNQATVTLENAQDALDGATIKAPIAGRILTVGGKVGSQVSAGSAFVTLADVFDMQITAEFPEADADRLAAGQQATATLADRAGQSFEATVVQVDPVGTSDGTMVRYGVLLSFAEAPKDLLVGQSANVRVTTGAASDVLRVPSTAVHDVAGTAGTVLRDAGGAGAPVRVGVGLRGDQFTQITSGLAEGDSVVRSW